MGFRFQKRLTILPGVRLNLSKGGVSTSLGPRGADVNIGKDGVTTNAGIPGTGLSYRSRLGTHGSWLGVALLVGVLAFWAGRHGIAPAPSATAQAASTSTRFVHRAGSVLRDEPKASGKSLKKESKGAAVTVIEEKDGWAHVRDGALTGWMRASVLGADAPD